MNYRERLYSAYASGHAEVLYGKADLEGIRRQFPVWKSYFGSWLPANKEARILDIGCGNGDFVFWLQSIGYKRAQGIDISSEQIERGKKLGINNLEEADLLKFLRTRSGEYDAIIARDVLEHLNKDEVLEVLELIHEALNDGGMFFAQTVNAEGIFGNRLRYADFTHEIAFTKESMRQVLRATGFRDLKIAPQRPVVHGLFSLVRFIFWMCVEIKYALYLLAETGSWRGIFTQNILVFAKKR